MAQLNTILTNDRLAGADQQFSTPADFGSQIGAAIQGAGETLGNVGGVVARIAQVKKQQSDTQWVGDSMSQEQNYVNKWMADPQNNAKTSFADDLQQVLKDRQNEYEKNAPNTDAKLAFRQQFQDFSVSRLHSAFTTSAANQINKLQESTLGQIDNAIAGYSISRTVPNLDANGDLVNNIRSISANIDKTYGAIAPETARQLKGKLLIDSIYASMNYSPELARKILGMSDVSVVEGRQRHSIEDEINQSERTINSAQVAQFDQYRQNWVAQVESGKLRDKISLDKYQSIYSRDQANAHKLRDDALIDIYNQSNDFGNKVAPYNAEAQLSELQKLKDKVGSNQDTAFIDSKAYELAEQKVHENLQLIKQDPVGYITTHNPVLKGLSDKYNSAPDDVKPLILAQMARLSIQYQGPSTGNHVMSLDQLSDPNHVGKEDDSNLYFNIPRNSVSVLTKGQAEQFAAQVNHGSPKDALKAINQILGQYPEDLRANAFNDMVKLPDDKRIRGEFWAAVINNKAPWIDDYLGTIQNAEDIKKATSDKQADFTKAMNSNTTWLHFSNPLASDNFQRQSVTEDFRSGIMLYAMGLAQKSGLSPDAAIKQSVDNILNSNMGMTSVNGKGIIIPRDANGLMRNDQEIKDIGRRLNFSLNYLDINDIKRDNFPGLNFAGTEETKNSSFKDAIMKHGTFQTTPDGKAAVLYYDDGMNHFEMRDKDNKAFMIRFDDLPKFRSVVDDPFFMHTHIEMPGRIPGKYVDPITRPPKPGDDPMSYAFTGTVKTGLYQTNWVKMPDWIIRK